MSTMDARIVAAALERFAQYGVSKTTVEDVASAAGCSRATLYRYFPGKQALIRGVVEAEVRRLADRAADVAGTTSTLEDLVVALLTEAAREFEGHDALRHVLTVEPDAILPHLAFERGNVVLAVGSAVLAPHLGRYLRPADAARAGEWLCRVALTYLCSPSRHVSLTDSESVRRLVLTFVLPGLERSMKAEAVPAA